MGSWSPNNEYLRLSCLPPCLNKGTWTQLCDHFDDGHLDVLSSFYPPVVSMTQPYIPSPHCVVCFREYALLLVHIEAARSWLTFGMSLHCQRFGLSHWCMLDSMSDSTSPYFPHFLWEFCEMGSKKRVSLLANIVMSWNSISQCWQLIINDLRTCFGLCSPQFFTWK